MTHPGFPSLPAKPPLPGLTPQAKTPEDSAEARILKLPVQLLEVRQKLQVQGRVIDSAPNGTVRIRTDQGDIEIRLPRNQAVPAKGQDVQIDIPPGRPPQSAEMKTQNAPPRTFADAPPETPRPTQTPVSVEVKPQTPQDSAKEPAALFNPQKPLERPVTVQLAPASAEDIARPAPQQILTQIVSVKFESLALRTARTANAITQNLQSAGTIIAAPPTIKPALPLPLYEPQAPVFKGLPAESALQKIPQNLAPQLSFATAAPPQTPLLAADPKPAFALESPRGLFTSSSPVITTRLPVFSLTARASQPITLPGTTLASFEPLQILPQKIADLTRAQITLSPALPFDQTPFVQNTGNAETKNILKTQLILQNAPAHAVTALVIGHTKTQQPVVNLQSPALPAPNYFTLQIPGAAILQGTTLTLIPQTQNTAPLTHAPANPVNWPAPTPLYFTTPEPWPLLQEIEQTLAHILPAAGQSLTNITPSPANPANFGPAALFFIAAVRGGDLTQWLGDRAIDTLRRAGRTDLLSRLTQESSGLNRLTAEPVSQEWRGLTIPLLWQNEMHKIALFTKQDSQGGNDNDPRAKQMRFIFDLKLDQMGKVQLDGLFRKPRLDLILRTQIQLSQSMQMTMRRAYTNALELAGTHGEISFQNRPEQWVTIHMTPTSVRDSV